jgi:hypothetical protein
MQQEPQESKFGHFGACFRPQTYLLGGQNLWGYVHTGKALRQRSHTKFYYDSTGAFWDKADKAKKMEFSDVLAEYSDPLFF